MYKLVFFIIIEQNSVYLKSVFTNYTICKFIEGLYFVDSKGKTHWQHPAKWIRAGPTKNSALGKIKFFRS